MKIGLLSEKYTPDPGGLAISSEGMGKLLAAGGFDVRVFAPSGNLPAGKRQSPPLNGIPVTRFGAHKRMDDTLVEWFELPADTHAKSPFDLIHAYFFPQAGFVWVYAGKYLNMPSIVFIRGKDVERAPFDPALLSSNLYPLQNADAVTANTTDLAEKAQTLVKCEIVVIPNGIDTGLFRPLSKHLQLAETLGLPAETGNPPNPAGIDFMGERVEKKGLADLFYAYTQVCRSVSALRLIVGTVREGEDKKRFEEFREAHPQPPVL